MATSRLDWEVFKPTLMPGVLASTLCGAFLVALGAAVMSAWWLGVEQLVRVLPTFTPMVFNTALCFALAGAALLSNLCGAEQQARLAGVIGGILAGVAGAVLAEHLLDANLRIDWALLHAWLRDGNPNPGRMSVPTALAFLLAGIALVASPRVRAAGAANAVRALILGVGTIGALALAGYAVNASVLFPQYYLGRVAVHTAAGLVLLALGLRAFAMRFAWSRQPVFSRDNDRITAMGAAALVATALSSGIATFAILGERVQSLVRDDLQLSLGARSDTVIDLIALRETNARIAATRPAATRNLRVIRAGGDDGSNIANLRAVVDSFVKQGFSAIAYSDVDGRVVADGGRFVQAPALAASLATPDRAELLWDGGFVLRHRIAMHDAEGKAGEVVTEQALPVLTRMAARSLGRGETWDMGLCVARAAELACFPQRLNPRAFTTPLVNRDGEDLPMARALRGEAGTIITRDYRAQNVVAAYGPVGALGLGMVLKVDAAEVFGPIREQLWRAAGLLLLVVAAGTLLLRMRVRPLATQLEDALEERAAGLQRAQQMARLAHVVTRPDGSFESWSETLAPLIGVEPAQVPPDTRRWLEFLHPEDRDLFRRRAIEAGSKRSRTEVEYRLRRDDGAVIHLRQIMEPLGGETRKDGGLRWFNTLQDVTAQKRTEEVLRDSEGLKAAILKSSLDGLITIDAQGSIVEFNPAAEEMFGIARERALGQSMAEMIIPPRLRDAHHHGFSRYLATGMGPVLGRRLEIEALRADGTEFPVELAITPIKARSTPMFTGFIRDITQRRESERKIERLNRVYAVLSGINSMMVRARNRDQLFAEACRIAVEVGNLRLVHIALADLEAQRVRTVACAGDDLEFARRDRPLGAPGQPDGGSSRAILTMRPVVINHIRPESRDMTYPQEAFRRGYRSTASFPLIVGDRAVGAFGLWAGEPAYFDAEEVKLFEELAGDIAYAVAHLELEARVAQRTVQLNAALDGLRRNEAELELRVQQRTVELESANRELEAFSYSVSHDLRAPLRHVAGFAEMLREDCGPSLDENGRRYLRVIAESVTQMGQLIDDLLLFSRMGRTEMHPVRVSMSAVVEEVVRSLAGESGERKIEWEIGALPEVSGDRAMLRQVWVNLISNAVKYTRKKPVARVRIGFLRAEGEFFVEDNGAGFEMAYAGKLFGVFQRMHRAEEFEGTGVGLANVQRILIRHGGSIRAQARAGEGATFYFSLPMGAAGEDA